MNINMQSKIKYKGNFVLYNAPLKIHVEEAEQMRQIFNRMLANGKVLFIVDFQGTTYIDSAGLGVLVTINKRALGAGGSVVLAGLEGDVKKTFEITRLNQVFIIYDMVGDII